MNYGINNLYPKPTVDNTGTSVAGQRLAVAGSAVQFGTAFNTNTSLVAVDVQGNNVYCTFDGTTPSSSNGHILYVGDKLFWSKATAQAAKFIQVTAAATLQASEFGV